MCVCVYIYIDIFTDIYNIPTYVHRYRPIYTYLHEYAYVINSVLKGIQEIRALEMDRQREAKMER